MASEIIERFGKEGTAAMVKFGEEAKTVGEVLYKLGSAGLQARESLAALNSTMSMIVGTEANITQATNLVAASYNNFKDNIVGVTTLQEKFKYLNDVITATFQFHQVSLQELTDGYKTLIAMGKNSNMTFLEMSAVLGTLNDHLIRSGEAGRSMQTVLSRISKESTVFAKAFGIQIDPHAPLDILDILKQINARMEEGALTTEEVSKVFDRLGLRGARTFITLTENYKKLEDNIERLKYRTEDAANRMARIMLEKPDVAFRQLKQTLAILVREGFEPIVKSAHDVSLILSALAYTAESIPPPLQTILNLLLKIIVAVTTIGIATAAAHMISSRYFAKTGIDAGALSKGVSKLGEYFFLIGVATKDFGKSFKGIFNNQNMGRLAAMRLGFKNLLVAIAGSAAGLKFLAFLAASALAVYAYKKFTETIEDTVSGYAKLIGKQLESTEKTNDEITSIRSRISALRESGKASAEHIEFLEKEFRIKTELAAMDWSTGYSKQEKEVENIFREVNKGLGQLRKLKELKDSGAMKGEAITELGYVVEFGPTDESIERLRVQLRRALEPLSVTGARIGLLLGNIREILKQDLSEDARKTFEDLANVLEAEVARIRGLHDEVEKETRGAAGEMVKPPKPLPVFSTVAYEAEKGKAEMLRNLSQEYTIR
jgi:TP901 family phage tail tape measure protein